MYEIAIVTASSEDAYPLMQQCLASCDYAIRRSSLEASYTAFCYECNWNTNTHDREKMFTSFESQVNMKEDMPFKYLKVVQKQNVKSKYTYLPDIATYDTFTREYLKSPRGPQRWTAH